MAVEMSELREASMDALSSPVSCMRCDEKEAGKDDALELSSGMNKEEEEEEDEEEFDSDSGMGSDDYDLLEVGGEAGTEFCHVGDQTCSIPLELYDLLDLSQVLSLDVWNDCLSADEKLHLCKYLPDMDQATFMITLKDLLSGSNICFGNPVTKFGNMLKGGLCEPRVALRRQGLLFFQKQRYYHFLRNYQNNMVCSFFQIKEDWSYCEGQAVEDKIKFLNDIRRKRSLELHNLQNGDFGSDSTVKEDYPDERLWSQRIMYENGGQLTGRDSNYVISRALEFSNHNDGLMNPKILPKLPGTRQKSKPGYDSWSALSIRGKMQDRNDATSRRSSNSFNIGAMKKTEAPKLKKKKHEDLNTSRLGSDAFHPKLSLNSKGKSLEMLMQKSRDAASLDFCFRDSRNARRKKEKLGWDTTPALNMNSYGSPFSPMSDRYFQSTSKETSNPRKLKYSKFQNGEADVGALRGVEMLARNDDTESDSSEQRDEGAHGYHLKKLNSDAVGRFADAKAAAGMNIARHHKKRKTGRVSPFEVASSSRKSVNLNEQSQMMKTEGRASKMNNTRKGHDINEASNYHVQNLEYQNHSRDYTVNGNGLPTRSCRLDSNRNSLEYSVDEEDDSLDVRGRMKRGKGNASDLHENINTPMLGCTSVKKINKGKKGGKKVGNFDDTQFASFQPVELGATDFFGTEPSDTHATEMDMMSVDPEPTPQRKPFTLITPTVDPSFVFSVIHLLSAVRIALITPYLENTLDIQHYERDNGAQEAQNRLPGEVSNGVHPCENMEGSNSSRPGQVHVPTFSIQEIINRVRLNPGDPCILETPEPLQDLVRGVLKIFSSKLAPLGAKGWKPIANYERSTKSWSWIGPLTRASSDPEMFEEVTSPEAWGLPRRMLVKLVDAFAIWLKNSQETLREIGSLPPPPASLMLFNIDAKDRLKDLRAQKSLSTISPSTEEVRDYFRREEYLRYSIPDRAFSYTAADGKKSTVAPLRRGGGKPTSKARDHFMLKSDRPPHVTILCLVRDAAARLPGSIGTRADVCTLIRDSQYVSEDVTDAQVTQILSGALDRLHYERDPCVRFEQERKLWVYLHRDRDEEDFDEDGTLSTKKWKKPKKEEAADPVADAEQTVEVVASPQPQLYLDADQLMNQEIPRINSELDVAF
uniref:DEUBAD domain-containing protein n=1 Tax=Kalanchoe fedtschenkoi TaxID=63787 RepID=A0A7N0UM76_KALFE